VVESGGLEMRLRASCKLHKSNQNPLADQEFAANLSSLVSLLFSLFFAGVWCQNGDTLYKSTLQRKLSPFLALSFAKICPWQINSGDISNEA
jgi:hypothetical protein